MIKTLLPLICLFFLSIGEMTQAQTGTTLYKFVPPSFGNGDEAIGKYFRENTILKSRDFKYEVKGAVVVKFTLTKEGDLKSFVMMDSSTSTNFNQDVMKNLKLNKGLWHKAAINGQFCDINIIVKVWLTTLDGTRISYIVMAEYNYSIDPLLMNNYYNIGSDFASRGLFQDAIPFFDVIINRSTTDVDALYNRGVCHMKTGDMAKACADWQIIQNSGKQDADRLLLKYCAK